MSYRSLLETLDAWFARGRRAAAPFQLPCRRGCSACCHGPFDISPADAELVAQGVAALPEAERDALRARAGAQLRRAEARAPGWGAPWDVEALGEPRFDALVEELAAEPCPALDAAGGCLIHAHRPATCRMLGLAMAIGAPAATGADDPAGGAAAGPGDAVPDTLENCCPIQALYPGYATLPPEAFDLSAFEDASEDHAEAARRRGFVATTIAGAAAAGA